MATSRKQMPALTYIQIGYYPPAKYNNTNSWSNARPILSVIPYKYLMTVEDEASDSDQLEIACQ